MGRRNRKRKIQNVRNHRRDAHRIAKRSLIGDLKVRNDWRKYEDRRTWHPEGHTRPARSFNRTRHRLGYVEPTQPHSMHSRRNQGFPSPSVGFEEPQKVLICARRELRKRVLHALNKTGKGTKRNKPKFNEYSKISCRRT